MNYPVWDVPHIGSGWVIGLIAIFHVLISHFAVGGGLYLVIAERRARRIGSQEWIEVLKWHSKFFLILTGIFGAVSGVGIWFAIGLANPEATSALIHNFVFAWATEWTVFFVELAAAAVYYYSWDRISATAHVKVGWIYAVASFFTLVIINGILTFMLTPGQAWLSVAGTGREATQYWRALFNPTYWPSLVLRSLICLNLAAIWALISYSRLPLVENNLKLKAEVIRWSSRWILPGAILLPLVLAWYLWNVPSAQRALLSFGIHTIGTGVFTQATRAALIVLVASAGVVWLVYLFGIKSPQDIARSHAIAILVLATIVTAAGEYTRELLRKPYVIAGYMYSNGVRVSQVARYNAEGYLTHSPWAPDENTNELAIGEAVFRGQCLSCHTRDAYRSMKRLLAGRNAESIQNLLTLLHEYPEGSPYRRFMPPLVGSDQEIEALVQYLASLVGEEGNKPAPAGEKQVARHEPSEEH